MRNSVRVAGIAVAAGIAMAVSAVAAPTSYDGRWSVHIVAASDGCQLAHAVPIAVENGSVRYIGSFNAVAEGRVASDGTVRVQLSRGEDIVQAHGSLARLRGNGVWSTPTQDCSGTWIAHRT